MVMRVRLALRNIFRHFGRTAVSLLMVAGAVVGLVLFAGFSDNILMRMQRIVIDNQYGHLEVGTRAFWNLEPGKGGAQLIKNADALAEKLKGDQRVESVSGRLSFFGLVSTGDITVSAKGMGFDPNKERKFTQNLVIITGESLAPDSKLDVILGLGLQKKVNAKVGDTLAVLSYTLDGVVNAVDLTVKGVFSTSNAEVDDNVFMLPLATAQILLDTDRVDVLSIRVDATPHTNAVRIHLQEIATQVDANFQVRTWSELAVFYRQVESFYATQNLIIEIILLSLVFLGILNTASMSVYERTGEIGTVLALGETSNSVVGQFAFEGLILGVLGALCGAVLAVAVSAFINIMNFPIDLPGTSVPIQIKIALLPGAFAESMFVVILASVAATWIPSLRASKTSITEALKKNI